MFHGYDYSKFTGGTDLERAKTISGAVNFIMDREKVDDKDSFVKEALMLHQALSLCSSLVDEESRFEAAFFESVRVLVIRLTNTGVAFYDALTKPQAIKDFYENEELIAITKELADTLRRNKTIDWQKRESARAKMRMLIKKLLKKHKYPPEGMEDAVQTVMTQCELWTDNNDMGEEKVVNFRDKSISYAEANYAPMKVAESTATYDELKVWYQQSGLPIKKFFNTSGLVYKEMQLKDKLTSMSEEEQLMLLATHGMLVKRPMMITHDIVLVGFKEADWEGALL